ncbi:channel protein TolC [Polaribacter pacificus]|uniref:Channel protein TolC n=2 Tax=Polaribacter pacificus TaxID=1775173 RepID=A0A917HW90_9FLAO|nr:channel protein TolC [Polaribacter pacificus]
MRDLKKHLFLLFALTSLYMSAQQVLTKAEALKITLENNYGIKIANNNVEVAKNNSSIFNTGYLPTAGVSSGATYRRDNQTITRQDGTSTSIDGAITKSYNASLNLNYTLFDGMGRKYNYDQLIKQYQLTELQARETIENTYLQLFTVYFQIARLSENTNSLKESLQISKKRLQRAKYQYEYGQSTRLELLNAEVDVNNDSIALLDSQQQFLNQKWSLNTILGVQKTADFEVETTVNFATLTNIEDLISKSKTNNVLLKQNEKNIAISEFNIKINKSDYLPTVGLTTSYGWNKSQNPATSFLAQSSSNGLNAGINLSWNIFDGGSTKTRIANAKIALENQQIQLQEQIATLENTLRNAWSLYNNKLFVLKAQEQNMISTQNNFDRTREKYNLGQVTSIEFRQAQINLANSKIAYNNTKYDAKLIELQLLQLSGELLNNTL